MSVARVPCPCRINVRVHVRAHVYFHCLLYISIVYFFVNACGSVFVGMSASKPMLMFIPMPMLHVHWKLAWTPARTWTRTWVPCMDSNIGTGYEQGHGHSDSWSPMYFVPLHRFDFERRILDNGKKLSRISDIMSNPLLFNPLSGSVGHSSSQISVWVPA
jgi:hypothetical protein